MIPDGPSHVELIIRAMATDSAGRCQFQSMTGGTDLRSPPPRAPPLSSAIPLWSSTARSMTQQLSRLDKGPVQSTTQAALRLNKQNQDRDGMAESALQGVLWNISKALRNGFLFPIQGDPFLHLRQGA